MGTVGKGTDVPREGEQRGCLFGGTRVLPLTGVAGTGLGRWRRILSSWKEVKGLIEPRERVVGFFF